MGVKTGIGGMNILDRDVEQERGAAGRKAASLAKAKSGGAGIGGLLGAIIGQILIPIPGVGAAIGGAIGGWGGSKIGGMTSGTSQKDLMGGKFFKNSRVDMAKQIAQSEFMDVAKSAASGYMMSGSIGKGLDAFKTGAAEGGGLLGGIKGLGAHFNPIKGLGSQTEKVAGGVIQTGADGLSKAGMQLPDGTWIGSASQSLPSMASGGIKKLGQGTLGQGVKSVYGGADKFLGGILPGGEKLSGASLGGAFGGVPKAIGKIPSGIQGLLGSQNPGQTEFMGPINQGSGMSNMTGIPEYDKMGANPFAYAEDVLDFQQQYNQNLEGPMQEIAEDSMWGPETSSAYDMWQMNQ